MYTPNTDLANTPGIYYALTYGLSVLLYVRLNETKGTLIQRILSLLGIWTVLSLFMTVTYRVRMALFIPCMLVDVFLIFLMIHSCCSMPLLNTVYFTAQTFMLGEFAASLEWQLFYFGLTNMGLPLNLWVNLLFMVPCHGIVFGIVFLLERRFMLENKSLTITRKQLWPVIAVTVIIFALSNTSYVLKDTPFSSQLTAEIFTIRTLMDLGGVAILFAYRRASQELQYRHEIDCLQQVMMQQFENYQISEESINLVNRKYHDLKHQIAFLKSDISDSRKMELLDGMEDEIRQYELLNQTGNHVVDAVLMEKRQRAGKSGIQLNSMADGTAMDFLPVIDICSLLGNALDNAIEAAEKVKNADERLISLFINRHRKFVCIRVENRFEGIVHLQDGIPAITTKEDQNMHGYGVRSIKYIVEKYEGSMKIEMDDGWFRLLILIPED